MIIHNDFWDVLWFEIFILCELSTASLQSPTIARRRLQTGTRKLAKNKYFKPENVLKVITLENIKTNALRSG